MATVKKEPISKGGDTQVTSPILFAWSLANFNNTPYEKDFVFNGNVAKWAKSKNSTSLPLVDDLSGLERCVLPHASTFNYSARAAEYFKTVRETSPKLGTDIYTSMNYMLMNGKQFSHYHPDFFGGYPETSLRIAVVYPAANTDPKQMDGLKFNIFKLEKPLLDLENKIITGKPVSPQNTVYFEPGHIAMIMFRDGVHSFEGNGLVTSIHPLDVGAHNRGNTYDANTVGWNGPIELDEQKVVNIKTSYAVRGPGYTSLQDVYGAHTCGISKVLAKIAESHNPEEPISQDGISGLRSKLKEPFRNEPSRSL